MSNEQELEQIEISLEMAKEKVELGEALERLQSNVDFKKVFTESYLDKYAIRLVNLKSSIRMQDDANQKYIEGQLIAIGQLNQYMAHVRSEAISAKASINADENTREEILQEELN